MTRLRVANLCVLPIVLAVASGLSCRPGGKGTKGRPESAPPGAAATATPPAIGGPGVLTRSYSPNRTGATLNETILSPGDITTESFGKLYCQPVDDEIYGQILYVTGVDFGAAGRRNAVYVVTMNDSAYAFDADDPNAPTLWEAHYADPANGITPVPARDLGKPCIKWSGGYKDISRQVGILSTPVIDPASGTLYLVARTKEGAGKYVQRLHAVGLGDGRERPNSPVVIEADTAGTGDGSVDGRIAFEPRLHNQRAGLLLHEGVVYIAWASHCDEEPYHGWVIGYDARSLQQVVVYNDTPTGKNGGIWMSGQAPAVDDAGHIVLVSGNGTADLESGPNRGQAIMKLKREGSTLTVVDWFTPFNYQILENEDRDIGSAGALIIPGANIALGGGKEGRLYVVDLMNMGKYRATDDNQIIQSISLTGPRRAHNHSTPVYWKSNSGEFVYTMAEEDFLRQFKLVNAKLELFRTSAVRAPRDPNAGYTMPGGVLALSANNEVAGIVWVNIPAARDAIHAVVPGVLRAFDAGDVTTELWNSERNPERDSYGNFAKNNPVTVYNGRVYVPTFSNQFCVYGRRP